MTYLSGKVQALYTVNKNECQKNVLMLLGVLSVFYFSIQCCHKPTPARPEFDVVALGISNAGKSTLLAIIANEEIGNVQPTKGR